VPQLGIVQIDDDVEIGANTTIDRARFGRNLDSRRGQDRQPRSGCPHTVVIGKHTRHCGADRNLGQHPHWRGCLDGGQVGVAGHIEIGDGTTVGAQAGVTKSISGGTCGRPRSSRWLRPNNTLLGCTGSASSLSASKRSRKSFAYKESRKAMRFKVARLTLRVGNAQFCQGKEEGRWGGKDSAFIDYRNYRVYGDGRPRFLSVSHRR